MKAASYLDVHEARLLYSSVSLFNLGASVTLLLFLASINILLLRKWQGKRIHFPTLVFLFIIVIVDVTYFGIANRIHEVTLLESVHAEENDFSPGTPACTFRAVMSNVLSTLSILLNDVFFIYRAYILFRKNRLALLLPGFLYFGLIVTGFISFTRCTHPTVPQYMTYVPLTFDGLTIVLNAILALMVSFKLFTARRNATRLGPQMTELRNRYLTTIGMVIESALAWTVTGLIFLISQLLKSEARVVLKSIFEITGGLSPAILIFRIVFRIHYSNEHPKPTCTCKHSQSHSQDYRVATLQLTTSTGSNEPDVEKAPSLQGY